MGGARGLPGVRLSMIGARGKIGAGSPAMLLGDGPPAAVALGAQPRVVLGGLPLQLALQATMAAYALGVEDAGVHRAGHRTARLTVVGAVPEAAAGGEIGHIGERERNAIGVPGGQTHTAQPGGVDEGAAGRHTTSWR